MKKSTPVKALTLVLFFSLLSGFVVYKAGVFGHSAETGTDRAFFESGAAADTPGKKTAPVVSEEELRLPPTKSGVLWQKPAGERREAKKKDSTAKEQVPAKQTDEP